MRVAIVSNFYPPIQTGSCYWAQNLARAHVAAGDEVIVVTVGDNRELVEEQEEGFTIYRLPAVFRLPRLDFFMKFDSFLLMNNRANRQRLHDLLLRHDIEIVHQSNHLLDCIFLVDAVCRRLDLPWLCTIHGAIRHSGSQLYSAVMRIVDRLYIRRTMERADAIVSMDAEIADYVASTYRARRETTIPLASMTTAFLEGLPRADPGHVPEDGRFRVASVGHVTENRDRTDLVRAARIMRDAGVDVHFEIIGRLLTDRAPELAKELRVEDCFTFHGELPRETMLELLVDVQAEAHLFFMPGLGNATLEAMAVGLPTMCFGYQGIYGDVPLQDGENILFADLHRPETIATPLARLATDPQARARIGRNARELVATHLTWDTVILRYRSLYADLLAANAK